MNTLNKTFPCASAAGCLPVRLFFFSAFALIFLIPDGIYNLDTHTLIVIEDEAEQKKKSLKKKIEQKKKT